MTMPLFWLLAIYARYGFLAAYDIFKLTPHIQAACGEVPGRRRPWRITIPDGTMLSGLGQHVAEDQPPLGLFVADARAIQQANGNVCTSLHICFTDPAPGDTPSDTTYGKFAIGQLSQRYKYSTCFGPFQYTNHVCRPYANTTVSATTFSVCESAICVATLLTTQYAVDNLRQDLPICQRHCRHHQFEGYPECTPRPCQWH